MQNTITFEEMRQLLGKDVVVDEARLYGNMFSAATSASADSEGAANQGNNKDQPENQHGKQTSPGKPKTSETRNKSASVSENTKLTEAAQLVNLSESLQVGSFTEKMEKYWSDAMEDVQDRVSNQQDTETITAFTTGLVTQLFHEKARPFVERSFLYGFQEGLNQMGNQFTKLQPGDGISR